MLAFYHKKIISMLYLDIFLILFSFKGNDKRPSFGEKIA